MIRGVARHRASLQWLHTGRIARLSGGRACVPSIGAARASRVPWTICKGETKVSYRKPPALIAEHGLSVCSVGVTIELQAGSYAAMSRPKGVMKKPFNRC